MPAASTARAAPALGSRDRLLDAAIDLMRGFGLAGTGINDLVRASAAPKGSIYHFFPGGKLQIAGEALALYAVRVEAFIDEALGSRRTPEDKVRALFDAFARRVEATQFTRSCAAGCASLDLGEDLEPLRATLVDAFEAWTRVIASHLEIGDARRAWSFASLVLTAIEGAYVRARAEHSSQAFVEAGTWLSRLAALERR